MVVKKSINASEKYDAFPGGIFEVYGRISKFEEYEDDYEIEVDLLNDKLIALDVELISLEQLPENYRPFYYGMTVDWLSEEGRRFVREINDGEWHYIKLMQNEDNPEVEQAIGLCTVTFSASPVETEIFAISGFGSKLNKKMPQINLPKDAFTSSSNCFESVYDTFECLLSRLRKLSKYQVLHIGQGHQSRLFINSKEYVCYDIGFSKCGNTDKSIKRKTLNFKGLRAVILSHWDADHIFGAFTSEDLTPLEVPWVAPSIIKSHNAKRLALTIYKKNTKNLLLLRHKVFLIFSDLVHNILYTARVDTNETNNSGIGLFIERNNKRILSIGDANYSTFSPDLFVNANMGLDYLVVSHHGAEIKDNPPHPRVRKNSKAIIPVGKNSYQHPRTTTLKMLKELNYKVHRTDYDGSITIDLGELD